MILKIVTEESMYVKEVKSSQNFKPNSFTQPQTSKGTEDKGSQQQIPQKSAGLSNFVTKVNKGVKIY